MTASSAINRLTIVATKKRTRSSRRPAILAERALSDPLMIWIIEDTVKIVKATHNKEDPMTTSTDTLDQNDRGRLGVDSASSVIMNIEGIVSFVNKSSMCIVFPITA